MTQGETTPDARYAPPRAQVEDIRDASAGTELATRWQRFWAFLIDALLGAALVVGASMLAPWLPWADVESGSWQPTVMETLFGFGSYCILHAWLLATRGQTVGKAVLGVRIVRSDGGRAGLARLLGLRAGLPYAVMFIPVVGQVLTLVDTLMIFRSSRRCLHDVIADTIVVKA